MSFEPVFVASSFRRATGLRPLSLHGLCLVILLALPRVNSQCYFPNRTQNTNSDYQPCPPAAQGLASMCCATNRTSNPDTCHPNGLCEGHGEVGAGFDPEAPYYRESCTDKSWNSTYCLKLCIGAGKTIHTSSNDVPQLKGVQHPTEAPQMLVLPTAKTALTAVVGKTRPAALKDKERRSLLS